MSCEINLKWALVDGPMCEKGLFSSSAHLLREIKKSLGGRNWPSLKGLFSTLLRYSQYKFKIGLLTLSLTRSRSFDLRLEEKVHEEVSFFRRNTVFYPCCAGLGTGPGRQSGKSGKSGIGANSTFGKQSPTTVPCLDFRIESDFPPRP